MKIAFRALWRNKVHSSINILGLSLGISCCILIALFINDEWTFDTFHSKADRIYRVYGREDRGENQQFIYTSTPYPMGPALKDNLPEVESQVRIKSLGTQVKVGDNQFTETVTIGGKDLFRVFDFEVVKGNREGILDQQSNVVVSNGLAEKYFGEEDPINKVISIQFNETFEDFTIVAVCNVPTNSSIQFHILISDLNFPRLYNERLLTSAWFNVSPETYVLLREGVDPKTVEAKFPSLFRTLLGEEDFKRSRYAPGLQPLATIHLSASYSYPTGIEPVSDPRYSYILAAIALLILFVGCINFVTLSVGRSMKRAKEVGITILKGSIQSGSSKQGLRKALVGVQVVLSIFLISSTLVMRNQLQFLQNKNLGFNTEQLAVVQLSVPGGGKIAERVKKDSK